MHWKRQWGNRYTVLWMRGHPEKRARSYKWSKEDWGNWFCDRRCDETMVQRWPWGERVLRKMEEELSVVVGGDSVHCGVVVVASVEKCECEVMVVGGEVE